MQANEFDAFIDELFDECRETLKRKGADYCAGEVDDRHDNFKRCGKALNLHPRQTLWVYMAKHFDSLTTLARTGRVESEGVRGRFVDMICYNGLWAALEREIELKTEAPRDGA